MSPGERIREEEGEEGGKEQCSELNDREKVYLKALSSDFLERSERQTDSSGHLFRKATG